MNLTDQKRALACAIAAARAAGRLLRRNLRAPKVVHTVTPHDIKLELDVRCQKLIERKLCAAFPKIALLGEEGNAGAVDAQSRWVVDPIDGTVNFAYGIPHACVSIALQAKSGAWRGTRDGKKTGKRPASGRVTRHTSHVTLVGVVYDPFQNELWTAIRGQRARLNGKPIRVSRRGKLAEALLAMGFAKSRENLEKSLPYFNQLARRVLKVRSLGAAALALTYVATGRFDAYIERGISLWDIAAGGLILECAGGEFWREPISGRHRFRMIASNGLLREKLVAIGNGQPWK
jgi:myo-inositol-1(or 4)-monophosphatase